MSRWWRAYDEAVDDPKLQRLPGELFKTWFNLCCLTSQNGGALPSIADMAFKLRLKPDRLLMRIADLRDAGLIDGDGTELRPHNWNVRQYKSDVSTERVKRFRKQRGNVSPAVSETPPETETEKDTKPIGLAAEAAPEPVDEDPKTKLFRVGKTALVSWGIAERRTGALIGQWLKARPDPVGLLAAIQYARDQNVADPVAYVSSLMHGKESGNAQRTTQVPRNGGDLARELAAEVREREREAGLFRPADAVRGN